MQPNAPRHAPIGIAVAAAALCLVGLVAVFTAASSREAREDAIDREPIAARLVANTGAEETTAGGPVEPELNGAMPESAGEAAPAPTAVAPPVAEEADLVDEVPGPEAAPDAAGADAAAVAVPPGTEPDLDAGAGGAGPTEATAAADLDGGGDEPVPCGDNTCAPGMVCCNESCGFCSEPGGSCPQYSCAPRALPMSDYCGLTTCNVGMVCCNASCGTCVRPGERCDTRPCDRGTTEPASLMCGMSTCNVGMICCNPSCGTCVRPGETCSKELCD